MENSKQCKTVIVGFGNILMGDEGVGAYAIQELQKEYALNPDPCRPEIMDGGTAAFDVLLSLRDVDKLIIVDAVKNRGSPGEVYRFEYSEIHELFNTRIRELSLHDLNIIDALRVSEKIGNLPKEIVFIGVEPGKIELNMGLSKAVSEKIPYVINMVMKEVTHDCITAEAN